MIFLKNSHSYFSVYCPSCLLQREVVVELFVGEVTTFEREVITSPHDAIGDSHIVRELVGHYIVILVCTDIGGVIRETMQILVVVSQRQCVANIG